MKVLRKYVVFVKDLSDDDCINRRNLARDKHRADIEKMEEDGLSLLLCGDLSDKDGIIRGSSMVYYATDMAQVFAYMQKDTYTSSRVWDMTTVHISELKYEITKVVS
ncbi:hypothetical protein AYI68_g5616 [Smittium mucronatum]|uniref:YCII-related domain-containing protein n=1 Tax=Smittium mucronatum TaxID=133383 RepID=A0A1R0GTT1_9FUNG|nr:hypothetical protein AYI68_g5616 [Smittium mucronatum]